MPSFFRMVVVPVLCLTAVCATIIVFAIGMQARADADFKEQCLNHGGHVNELASASDLCLTEDGRIIEL